MRRGGSRAGYGQKPKRASFLFWHPRYWPRWLRRLFLLTLPLAIPLWIAVGLVLLVSAMLCAWVRPLRTYWNAPRRIRYDYGYHGYRGSDRSRAKLGQEASAAPASASVPAE